MTTNNDAAMLTCTLHPDEALVLLNQAPYPTGMYFCDWCFKIGEGQTYHCSKCKIDLHPTCCKLQPTLRSCAHPHLLTLNPAFHHTDKKKKCDGCRNPLAGCEWTYRCSESCNFDVHATCAKLREKVVTPFHSFPLKLHKKSPYPPRHLQCDLCNERMPTEGWVYHCTDCKFDLHPSCAVLPRDPLCSEHPHRLSVQGYTTYHGESYVCAVCLKFGGELGYRCNMCDFNIHPKCLKALYIPSSAASSDGDAAEAGTPQRHSGTKFKVTAYGVHIHPKCHDKVHAHDT